jgi:hypothetical protein
MQLHTRFAYRQCWIRQNFWRTRDIRIHCIFSYVSFYPSACSLTLLVKPSGSPSGPTTHASLKTTLHRAFERFSRAGSEWIGKCTLAFAIPAFVNDIAWPETQELLAPLHRLAHLSPPLPSSNPYSIYFLLDCQLCSLMVLTTRAPIITQR